MSEIQRAADEIVSLAVVDVARNARAAERKAVVEFLEARSHPPDFSGDYAAGWGMCAYDAARCIERGDHLP